MERTTVESSNVSAVGYDAESQTLEVQFKNGSVYQYLDVEPELHQSLLKADSVGRFLNQFIKPSFKFQKLENQKEAENGNGSDTRHAESSAGSPASSSAGERPKNFE